MAAYVSNIIIDVGANFDQSFNLESNANAPLDLTGFNGAAKLKKSAASLTTAASFVVSFPNFLSSIVVQLIFRRIKMLGDKAGSMTLQETSKPIDSGHEDIQFATILRWH